MTVGGCPPTTIDVENVVQGPQVGWGGQTLRCNAARAMVRACSLECNLVWWEVCELHVVTRTKAPGFGDLCPSVVLEALAPQPFLICPKIGLSPIPPPPRPVNGSSPSLGQRTPE